MSMTKRKNDARLILASGSPRRQAFLRELKFAFTTDKANVDERTITYVTPREYVMKTALAKAADVAARHERGDVVLAADTIVVLDSTIYPKPMDAADARRMLRELSGRTHQVITAVAVTEVAAATQLSTAVTDVRFHELTDDEITAYVATGEPMDKAGAYAIQGRGSALIAHIKGDWFNVVGLPIELMLSMLDNTAIATVTARRELERMKTAARD